MPSLDQLFFACDHLASYAPLVGRLPVLRTDGKENALSSFCLVQLSDGIGTVCDIGTSGIFFETQRGYIGRGNAPALPTFRRRDPPVRGTRGTGGSRAMVNSASPMELKSYVFC